MTKRRYALLALVPICFVACERTTASLPANPREALAQLLEKQLEGKERSAFKVYANDSMRVIAKVSKVVPGLTYYQGTYRPPDTFDMVYEALVVSAGGVTSELRSVDQWTSAAQRANWRIHEVSEAVEACAEMILTTGQARRGRQAPVIYRDRTTVQDPMVMLSGSASDVDSLAASPTAHRNNEGWRAEVWVLEAGRLVKYQCRLVADPNVEASLAEVRVHEGRGLAQ